MEQLLLLPNLRGSFCERFGEANALAIEEAANQHAGNDEKGSDPFRWAILTAIAWDCIATYASHHGITVSIEDVKAWMLEYKSYFRQHDGDYDILATLAGYYEFLAEEESRDSN